MLDIREMTVLVADDMQNMFNSIRSIMRLLKFGRRFFYAPNGEEALKILDKEEIDLAILDNNMPGMQGVEVLQIIREDKRWRDMPIIMITADATREFVTNAAESEIDAYLLKPITVELMREKIPSVIERANNPSPMMLHLRTASVMEEEGDLGGAIKQAKRAIAENPQSSRPLREVGKYLLESGNFDQAEQYLLKAVKMNKIDVIAFHHLGDLYLKRNDVENALNYFEKAIKISPRHYERGLNLGKILIQKKMEDKAIPIFTTVFEIAKNPDKLKEEIALFCIEEEVYGFAAKLLKGIVGIDKERAGIRVKLGKVLEKLGDTEEALVYFNEAEQLDYRNLEVKLHLARIYLQQGMMLRAERPLKEILKVSPNHKEARELLRQCI